MSIRDDLTEALRAHGERLITEKGREGFGKILDRSRRQLPEIAAAVSKELPGTEELTIEAGTAVLDEVDKNKDKLLRLTKWGFAQIVGHLESGNEAEARRVYIATEATFTETIEFQYASGDHATVVQQEREAAWEEVKSFLLGLGEIALKFLGKAAIASLGVPI